MGRWWLLPILLLAACAPAVSATAPTLTPTPSVSSDHPLRNPRVEVPEDRRYEPLLAFDAIPTIYDPVFAPAAQAPVPDEELVLGISLGGEAKAYPITVLRFREMVNDEIAGIPILASW